MFAAAPTAGAAPSPVRLEASSLPEGTPEADAKRLDASLRSGLERVEITVTDDETADALSMTVSAIESDYLVSLEVRNGGGDVVAKADVECELCGVTELSESIAAAASRLRQRLDLSGETVTLVVRTQPESAAVFVDDEPTGRTPVSSSVTPGSHELRVERRGYRPIQARFEATGGSDSTFDYDLRPRAYRVVVPWTLIGVGAVLVGGGAALVAIDGNQIQNSCNADIAGNCEFIRRTQPGGIAAISVGAAAIVTGTVFAILWRRNRRGSSAAAAFRAGRLTF